MPRIVLRTGSEAVEVELREGSNSIGRAAENDIVVDHPSVSTHHCNLEVEGESISVADLGSANGTLLAGELVDRKRWTEGLTLRVGPAYLEIVPAKETGGPAEAGAELAGASTDAIDPILAGAVDVSTTANVCHAHPKREAEFHCRQCGLQFCRACVKDLGRIAAQEVFLCTGCGARCDPATRADAVRDMGEPSFFMALREAWVYPFRKDGWILLAGASLLMALLDAVPGFIAIFVLFAMVLLLGYLSAYLQRIVQSSAQGEDRMPNWPDVSDFLGDILSPFLLVIGSVLFCLGPGFVLIFWGDDSVIRLGVALVIGGLLYLPMGFLAVSMHNSLWALNPMLVFPAIFRVPGQYLVTCIVLAAAVALSVFSGRLIDMFRIPVLSALLASFTSLYFLTVEMRLLGMLYWTNRNEFGWFRLRS